MYENNHTSESVDKLQKRSSDYRNW